MDEMVQEGAEKYGVSPSLIQQLIEYEQTRVHLQKRRGSRDDLRQIIEQYLEEQSS